MQSPVRCLQSAIYANVVLFTNVVLLASASCSAAADVTNPTPHWMWAQGQRAQGQRVVLQRRFDLAAAPKRAVVKAGAEFCRAELFANGESVARRDPYGPRIEVEVSRHLKQGTNTIGLICRAVDGPAAVTLKLLVGNEDGTHNIIASDDRWQAATISEMGKGWPPIDSTRWQPAVSWGTMAPQCWAIPRHSIAIGPLDDYTQWKRAIDAEQGTDPASMQVRPGFAIERIHSAGENEGSWISLAQDPQQRWVIGTEKHGLIRLTPPEDSVEAAVEMIEPKLTECRGLLFAHGSLYAMANGDKQLFRLRDTNGDGRFDDVASLGSFDGDAGHGRNQLTLGPGGRVHAICGDSVFEPKDAGALPSGVARPSRAESARSGFVMRMDADGKNKQVVVRGLRNPYGIAFNRHGDMFTYDADAEYDMGSPWYRPTRVIQLFPGGDYRWRRATGQWPPYFPDQADIPHPMLDIGKGSPTAVTFASGNHFPPPYRNALFVLDWAYGRILAVHLTPQGSSYAASAEVFLRGQPLNVTDAEFGSDGAMYFVTGGRATQSALYRVRYVGAEKTAPAGTEQQRARSAHAAKARRVRRELVSLIGHKQEEAAVGRAWPHLSSADPWIRYTARTVIETIPAHVWHDRAMAEQDVDALLAACMALVRVGPEETLPAVVQRVVERNLRSNSEKRRREAAFILARCLDSQRLPEKLEATILAAARCWYPADSPALNRLLARLLSRRPDQEFVSTTMELLQRAQRQSDRLLYLFVLRHAALGWTPPLRKAYFRELRATEDYLGGEGMPQFRKLIRSEALAAVPEKDRVQYEKRLASSPPSWQRNRPPEKRQFVQKWKVEDFRGALTGLSDKQRIERGRELFLAARCIDCHRFEGRGGVSGPDLSSAARRFSPRDMLVSILEPSRVVSEKYRNDTFQLTDGRVITGRIVPGDYRKPTLTVMPKLMEPEKVVTFPKQAVAARRPSTVSPMPEGLVDVLRREEVLDLLAYLRGPSRGVEASQ